MEALYFRENGSGEDEAIVFVHGGGIGGRLWQATLNALLEYHCLAPDLPGFGKSAHITPFSSKRAAEGLADLIRVNVPSGRAAVVGFSIGAVVCIELINRYPDLVGKAFLSGPTPRLSGVATTVMNAIARPLLSLIGPQQRSRLVARSLGLTDDQVDEFREDLDQLTIDLFIQINDALAGQRDPQANSPPAVVFAGEKELGAVKKRARQLLHALGNGKAYVVRGYGHVWCLENPELFQRTVRAWMSGAEPGEEFVPLTK
jgi:pimeloyl-ACP methyl ester carboxylesterase